MKRLLQFALLLFGLTQCVPAWAAFTFKQAKCTGTTTTDSCSGVATCTISGLTAITAHSTLTGIMLADNNLHPTISAINGETWTHCANCSLVGGTNQAIDASYVLDATGGETSFQFTLAGATFGGNVCIYEANTSLQPAVFDTAANALRSTATPTTPNLTLSGSNDWLVGGLVWGGSVTAVSASYTNFIESNGNGTANILNTASGTGASFTPTTANSGPGFTIAFKETAAAGGGVTAFDKRRRYEVLEGE